LQSFYFAFAKERDLCKTLLFAQFLRQAQILILEILNVFLWLKFSPSLNLNKNEHFSKVSSGGGFRFSMLFGFQADPGWGLFA